MAVGVALVALAVRWAGHPTIPIGVAVLAAAGWTVVADGAPTAVGALGLCVGTHVAWMRFESRLTVLPRLTGVRLSALLALGLAIATATVLLVEAGGPVVAGLGGAIGMAAVVALPLGVAPANA